MPIGIFLINEKKVNQFNEHYLRTLSKQAKKLTKQTGKQTHKQMFTHKCHDKSSFVSVCYRYRNCSYVVSVECLSLQSFSMTTCLWYGSLSGQRGTVLRNTSYCLSLSHCFSFTGKTYVVLTFINSWFSGDAIAAISIG